MSSRTAILDAVRRNRPASVPLPELPAPAAPAADLREAFARAVVQSGGQVLDPAGEDVAAVLARAYPGLARVASAVPELMRGAVPLEAGADPHDLASLELLVCRGTLGVAENGAVWLTESHLVHRAAPFLAEHLALVLDRRALVADMHEAYTRLHVAAEGFGVFVAGPSKTADIEQSLVIGAHGPRSLMVVLV